MEEKQIQVSIPGFTADTSLSGTIGGWLGVATVSFSTRRAEVVPQQRRSLGCFYTHSQGWVCCYCTPHEGCTCSSWGETMF